MSLFLVVVICAFVFGVFPRMVKSAVFSLNAQAEQQKIEQYQKELADHTFTVKCHGGIYDGQEVQAQMESRPSWYVVPYLPLDEETGQPQEDNHVGNMGSKHFFKPSFAYYQQVSDEDYFYVRDISEKELQKLAKTGDIPSARSLDE